MANQSTNTSPPTINPGGAIISNISSLPGIKPAPSNSSVVSPRGDFMQALSEWWTCPILDSLWAVHFQLPSLLTDANMNAWGEQLPGLDKWGVDQAKQIMFSPYTSKYTGCIFAESVNLPSDTLDIGYAGINQRGFTYSPYITKRREPYQFEINFYETGVSITDTILRPWLVLAGHLGLVTRKEGTIKTDIQIWELTRTGDFTADLARRKVWNLTGCLPFRINQQTKTYSPDSKIAVKQVDWLYTRYQVVQSS